MPKREGVMLAYPAEERRLARWPERFYLQPKLRGQRCWVDWFHGEPVLLSAYGNEYRSVPHIKDAIAEHFSRNKLRLDGELYCHGMSQQEITSICSRKENLHPDYQKIYFYIFDLKTWDAFTERVLILKDALSGCPKELLIVPSEIATKSNWMEKSLVYLAFGYEGTILRHPEQKYEEKRSTMMLKFKPTEEDTYEIVGVTEGTGWAVESLGAFIVRDSDGKTFSVGTGPILTKEGRAKLYKQKERLIGKTLVVKHEKGYKTNEGLPICAVALEVR